MNLLSFAFGNSADRFDPVYSDAKARAQTLGEFNFFNAWMSQPKSQLETFRAWAGRDSDIRQVTCPRVQDQSGMLTRRDVWKATTSRRTTLTSAVGSFKEKRSPLGLWPALPPGSLRENRTIVFPRQKTPSPFSSTGDLSRARGTAGLQFIPPPGLPRKTQVFTLLSTFTIWQKRSAFRH